MLDGPRGSRWRFLVTPKWLAWHVIVAAAVYGMIVLGDWQLHRALGGNTLSWAYTFEWPFFAILAVLFWLKTIRDELHPPAADGAAGQQVQLPAGARTGAVALDAGGQDPGGGADPAATEEDPELAAYNAYLARLHQEVKGHGKWHGWR